MLAFVDVQYHDDFAWAACVLARAWTDATASEGWRVRLTSIAPYEPGAFYRRELPCLLAVLEHAPALDCVVIDGYVTLDEAGTPGLGARLYAARAGREPVIGVAKTAFKGAPMASAVIRPGSTRPLFVTSVGIPRDFAAAQVLSMHGTTRVPTLLRAVDQLARQA